MFSGNNEKITVCSLGEQCYRKKKKHFKEFKHPHLDNILKENEQLTLPLNYTGKISEKSLLEQLKYLKKINCKTATDESSDSDGDITNFEDEIKVINKSSVNNNEMSHEKSSDELCSYGERCYRRNAQHFKMYSHPHLNALLKIIDNKEISIPKQYQPQISEETLILQLSYLKEGTKEINNVNDLQTPSSSMVNTETKINDSPEKTKNTKEEMRKAQNKAKAEKYRTVILDRVNQPMLDKLITSAPYNLFLSTISDSPATHKEMLSITFAELLDPNLGKLESSLQINFMVEIGWLLAQYHIMGHRNKPMTLLYGEVDISLDVFKSFLTSVKIKTPNSFGSHHTKMMVFSYTDKSIRIAVSTANLVESDWDNRTQGIWVSPRCRQLEDGSDTMAGESPTNFKRDIIKYLSAYKLPELVSWIKKLQQVDMSAIKVFFISSIPGSHKSFAGRLKHDWGHPFLANLLNEHITIPENNIYPLIVQCSSIGSLGKKPDTSWLLGDILTSFTSGKRNGIYSKPPLKFIYPSFDNVAGSYDGLLGGGCLPYSRNLHSRQEWLTSFLCQWISDKRHRTRAPPHIKSYCRVSPDATKLSYFVLTSANMSKAAWGDISSSGSLNILSYEAGVLFLPQFLIGKDYFPLTKEVVEDGTPLFPMPYDLPTTGYSYTDVPWFIDNVL